MSDQTDEEKSKKLNYARGELEKSSAMVLEMTDSIQALLEKFERTKAKQEKKRQKLQSDLAQQKGELVELTSKNENLISKQGRIKNDAKKLKDEMNDSIQTVLGDMERKFTMLETENNRLRQELTTYKGGQSSKS